MAVLIQASIDAFANAPSLNFRWNDPVQTELCASSSGSNPATNTAQYEFANLGLLQGILVNTSEYYTTELQMKSIADVEWLEELGLPYEVAKIDAQERSISVDDYLANVEDALSTYLYSSKVHDREDFYDFLNRTAARKGQFCLILGGKSVGKSLVLSDFTKQLRKDNTTLAPLLLNARDSPESSLATLILDNYKQLFNSDITKKNVRDVIDGVKKAAGVAAAYVKDPFLQSLIEESNKGLLDATEDAFIYLLTGQEKVTSNQALMAFVALAEKKGKHPILIVDEANLVLGRDEGIDAISNTLSTIVRLTKESKRLTVILASSEYGYPYLLVGNKRKFNLADISDLLFAGEIPPKSMWDFLVTKQKTDGNLDEKVIGMGDNLASLLIASYGGHLLQVSSAVRRLKDNKERFAVADELNQISAGIVACFKTHPKKTLLLLRPLAQAGFVFVSDANDPAVEMIVKLNIGGIVSREKSTTIGLPRSVWLGAMGENAFGLVPTSESARLVMAQFVVAKEKERKRWWKRLSFWRNNP